MNSSKLTVKKTLVIASLIFGMLFGAGNLIFPVHLGQLSGSKWLLASGGFITSGVLLPLLALLAISITRSDGIYDLARPISPRYAAIFLIFVHAAIGPFCATPRTATVPYEIGFAQHFSASTNKIGLLIFTAIFFILVYALSATEAKITDLIGKILNPIFLVMLFVIFVLAFAKPMGSAQTVATTAEYSHNAFTNGFLQGYNTMDCLAALIFGVTIITSVKELGIKKQKDISIATIKSGFWGIFAIAVLYLGLVWLGATSLHQFKLAANGGTTLGQISYHYMGIAGNALLATLTTITCLTTAMGLAVSFAQDFNQRFPRLSYKTWLAINCGLSFLVANMGLDTIIAWSKPVLMLLYPLAITLILVAIASPLFKQDPLVYRITIIFTIIPAIFDMVNATPAVIHNTSIVQHMVNFAQKYFPFFKLGFGWISFAILGFIIGIIAHLIRRNKKYVD